MARGKTQRCAHKSYLLSSLRVYEIYSPTKKDTARFPVAIKFVNLADIYLRRFVPGEVAMRKICVVLTLTVLFSLRASADELTSMDVFFGYSFFRVNSAQQIPAFSANGGIGTLGWNINNNLGIEAEFNGYHNGNVNDFQFDTTNFSFLFGPRVSYGRTKKFDPYVHALFGGMYATTSIAASSVLLPGPVTVPVSSSGRYKTSQTNFAMSVGGGIDIEVHKHVLLRPIQIDYVLTRFETPTLFPGMVGSTSNRNQNNFRFACGLAFTFNDPAR